MQDAGIDDNRNKSLQAVENGTRDNINVTGRDLTSAQPLDVAIVNSDGDHLSLGAGLVPENFDYIALTYVASGNGAGEIETVTYKTGGSGGTTVATLTLTYDASNNISTVTKT